MRTTNHTYSYLNTYSYLMKETNLKSLHSKDKLKEPSLQRDELKFSFLVFF